jgi:hypothetical protein
MALTAAQKQQAYRNRKRATPIAMLAEVEQVATRLLRVELSGITERWTILLDRDRRARTIAEQAVAAAAEATRAAEEALRQQGIATGTLHPSGRPWLANEVRSVDRCSPRAMQEAGRRAAVQQARGWLPQDRCPRRRPARASEEG